MTEMLDKEKRKARDKKFFDGHPDYHKKWRASHPQAPKSEERRAEIRSINKAWRDRNKDEQNSKSRERYKKRKLKDPEKVSSYSRKWHLRNRYGITESAFESMLLGQDGKCAICKTDEWGDKNPYVDHNHRTGKVRGILCHSCNMAIAFLDDEPGRAISAVEYLQRDWLDEAKVDTDENDREV